MGEDELPAVIAAWIAFGWDFLELWALIGTKGAPAADFAALGDVGVTIVACQLSGECYTPLSVPLDPSLPPMFVVNQDVLFTGGEFAGALGVKLVGAGIGALLGGGEGAVVGYQVFSAFDFLTTLASMIYDYNRATGALGNYWSVGISIEVGREGIYVLNWPEP